MATPLASTIEGDRVTVRNVSIEPTILDSWGRYKPQPALLTVTILLRNSFQQAAAQDALHPHTVHYGNLAKALRKNCSGPDAPQHLGPLIQKAFGSVLEQVDSLATVRGVDVSLRLPKALRRGSAAVVQGHWDLDASKFTPVAFSRSYEGLRYNTRIGVNENEKQADQSVVIDVEWAGGPNDVPMHEVEDRVADVLSRKTYETLESLAYDLLIPEVFGQKPVETANLMVRVSKPSAIPFAEAAAVEVRRGRWNGSR